MVEERQRRCKVQTPTVEDDRAKEESKILKNKTEEQSYSRLGKNQNCLSVHSLGQVHVEAADKVP